MNKEQYSKVAWDFLVDLSKDVRKTINYGGLMAAVGFDRFTMFRVLGVIQEYCVECGLPPLTILVVNKITGLPSSGFTALDLDDFENGVGWVREYEWQAHPNPFAFSQGGSTYKSLVQQLLDDPDSSDEVYRLVKDRGVCQILFRNALHQAYDDTCAFTGICYEGILEACHIIPWAEATPAQRLDVRNGILLNPLHHKLFDAHYITIDSNHVIHYADADEEQCHHNAMEKLLTVDLHGEKMHLPDDIDSYPLNEYIIRHNKKVDWMK